MNILGVSCFYHDSAAALLQKGVLIAAAEEERFSRRKHDSSYPAQAIQFCLDRAGITGQDLDYVVFYEKPFLKFERILLGSLGYFPENDGLFSGRHGFLVRSKAVDQKSAPNRNWHSHR